MVAVALHDRADDNARIAIGILLIYPFLHIVIIPHELGHALTASLMGFEVASVHIGHGSPLWSGILAGVPITYGSIPWRGFTLIGANSFLLYRPRMILVYLAGPAANFLCLYLAIHFASDSADDVATSLGSYILVAWVIANFLMCLVNLVPSTDRKTGNASDGLAIWRLLQTGPTSDKRRGLLLAAPLLKSLQYTRAARYKKAFDEASRAYSRDPSHPSIQLVMGTALFHCGQTDRARELLTSLLNASDEAVRHPDFQAVLKSQLALMDLLSNDPARWAIARESAVAAYQVLPWDNSITLIYGASVLLLDGNNEGEAILATVAPKTKATREFCTCVRALVLARAGALREASKLLDTVPKGREIDILRETIDAILKTKSPLDCQISVKH